MKNWMSVLVILLAGSLSQSSRAQECGAETRSEACNAASECGQRSMLDAWLNGDSVLADWQNMELGGTVWNVGGEGRYRYMDEADRLRPGGPGRSTYDLWRLTAFMEGKFGDAATVRVEAIDASIFNQDLPITGIDQNRADLLQYWIDVSLGDVGDGTVRAKVGRQLLLYGAQRLISPLGWANTVRNFEGAKLYYKSDDWDIDAFWVKPVNAAAGNVFRPMSFDHPDASRDFLGVYSSYKGITNSVVDFYWLLLDEDNDFPTLIDGERHTLGMRIAGSKPVKNDCDGVMRTWAWEFEGAYQTGRGETFRTSVSEDIEAGFLSAIVGHTWNEQPWTPTLKGLFWWGSGDNRPGDGTNNTVNTLFPFGHAYWGLIDNHNGSNLINYSAQLVVKPHEKLSVQAAYHLFFKDSASDPIFNVAGGALQGPMPSQSKNIGTEFDLVATYKVSKSLSVEAGYLWYWYGKAVTNDPALNRDDASQFYLMITQQF